MKIRGRTGERLGEHGEGQERSFKSRGQDMIEAWGAGRDAWREKERTHERLVDHWAGR